MPEPRNVYSRNDMDNNLPEPRKVYSKNDWDNIGMPINNDEEPKTVIAEMARNIKAQVVKSCAKDSDNVNETSDNATFDTRLPNEIVSNVLGEPKSSTNDSTCRSIYPWLRIIQNAVFGTFPTPINYHKAAEDFCLFGNMCTENIPEDSTEGHLKMSPPQMKSISKPQPMLNKTRSSTTLKRNNTVYNVATTSRMKSGATTSILTNQIYYNNINSSANTNVNNNNSANTNVNNNLTRNVNNNVNTQSILKYQESIQYYQQPYSQPPPQQYYQQYANYNTQTFNVSSQPQQTVRPVHTPHQQNVLLSPQAAPKQPPAPQQAQAFRPMDMGTSSWNIRPSNDSRYANEQFMQAYPPLSGHTSKK